MIDTTRRQFVLALAAGSVAGFAGCLGEDEEGLHAVNAQVVYGDGYPELDYPADVGVRVTVENDAQRRLEGTVVAELERLDGETDGDASTWSKERTVSLSSLTTQGYLFVFEDANTDGSEDAQFSAETYVAETTASGTPSES